MLITFAKRTGFIIMLLGLLAAKAHSRVLLQAKPFKVKSLPFTLNGLRLEFQYLVSKVDEADKSSKMVMIAGKKLVNLQGNVVVLDFEIEPSDADEPVSLDQIDKAKFSAADFQDVNFDGYKDIREVCRECDGATNEIEDVFLFDAQARKFNKWTKINGAGIAIDEKTKTVTSDMNFGGGEFEHQEFKFADKGRLLYETNISCKVLDERKRTYKLTYHKYDGNNKPLKNKTLILKETQLEDVWDIIAKL